MSGPDSRFLTAVPERIVIYLENNPRQRGLFSLYFDKSIRIREVFKDIREICARPILEDRRVDGLPLRELSGSGGPVAIDTSVKLWPRIVGEFSLAELEALLKTGVFLDVKIFGEQDIKIETE